MSNQPRIYLDNAAATAVDSRVLEAMQPCWQDLIGNAGALHQEGCAAHAVVEEARDTIARALGAHEDEIIYTSGGTESNNMGVMGLVYERLRAGVLPEELHVITTSVEHNSVSDCMHVLNEEGVATTYVPVDAEGFVDPGTLAAAIRPTTVLVSIIYAHNEIGTVQRMQDIARVVRRAREATNDMWPLLHIDASQALTWLPCKVAQLGVDLMTLDAQKMHGPKGVGCLYKARHVTLAPVLHGGKQESGLRPGTPPTPLIVGLGKAVALAEVERETYVPAVRTLRDRFFTKVEQALPTRVINGPVGDERLPNNINLSFPGLDSEQVVIELDARGIACSTRSACLLGSEPGSDTVRALDKAEDVATSAVRFTLSRYTTEEEIDRATDTLIEVVQCLQKK
jgi:cysteine desulfurase